VSGTYYRSVSVGDNRARKGPKYFPSDALPALHALSVSLARDPNLFQSRIEYRSILISRYRADRVLGIIKMWEKIDTPSEAERDGLHLVSSRTSLSCN